MPFFSNFQGFTVQRVGDIPQAGWEELANEEEGTRS